MGIADRLFATAREIAAQYQNRTANLQREIFDLEMQLQQKKATLHLSSVAIERARHFIPMRGPDFYCPACWIDKEKLAPLHPIPNDVMRCDVCGGGFEV